MHDGACHPTQLTFKMPTIAVLGATGGVGTRLVPMLLQRGHTLKVLARSEKKAQETLPPAGSSLSVVLGDSTNAQNVETLVQGCDVVVSCIGNAKGVHIMEASMKTLVAVMRKQKAAQKQKLYAITTYGVGAPCSSNFINFVLGLIIGRTSINDYDAADQLLLSQSDCGSGGDGPTITVVRPTGLRNEGPAPAPSEVGKQQEKSAGEEQAQKKQTYWATERCGIFTSGLGSVSREDVARFLAASVSGAPDFEGKAAHIFPA